MSAPLLVSICITLWAALLWVSLPKAQHLQARSHGLEELKAPLKIYLQSGFALKVVALMATLVKLKFH